MIVAAYYDRRDVEKDATRAGRHAVTVMVVFPQRKIEEDTEPLFRSRRNPCGSAGPVRWPGRFRTITRRGSPDTTRDDLERFAAEGRIEEGAAWIGE